MWESPNNRVAQHGPYLILHYFRDTVVGATHRMCKALALSILVNELSKSIVNRVLTLFHSARPGWGRQGSTLEQRRLQALGTHRRQRIGGEGRDVEKYDQRGAKIMPGGRSPRGKNFSHSPQYFPPWPILVLRLWYSSSRSAAGSAQSSAPAARGTAPLSMSAAACRHCRWQRFRTWRRRQEVVVINRYHTVA